MENKATEQSKVALIEIARHLGPLAENVVYIGGAILGFLITDEAAPSIRSTDDVDLVVEAATVVDYQKLDAELIKLGFRNDPKRHRCAYLLGSIKVDVLPSEPLQHGLKGMWLKSALQHYSVYSVKEDIKVKIVQAPYFLALKLEAFSDRGKGDFLHKDIEDIISLIDGRSTLIAEVTAQDIPLKSYIGQQFSMLKTGLLEYAEGHVGSAEKLRVPMIHKRIEQLASLEIS